MFWIKSYFSITYHLKTTKLPWQCSLKKKIQIVALHVDSNLLRTFPFRRSQNLRLWSKEPLMTLRLSKVKFKQVTASWWPVSVIKHEPSAKLQTFEKWMQKHERWIISLVETLTTRVPHHKPHAEAIGRDLRHLFSKFMQGNPHSDVWITNGKWKWKFYMPGQWSLSEFQTNCRCLGKDT